MTESGDRPLFSSPLGPLGRFGPLKQGLPAKPQRLKGFSQNAFHVFVFWQELSRQYAWEILSFRVS